MDYIFNKCPLCGSRVMVHSLIQYTKDTMIKKNGELYKNSTKSDDCPMEASFFSCTSDDCQFVTDCDGDYNHVGKRIHVYFNGSECRYKEIQYKNR